jgi:small subunit ribosomal protein S20
MANIKSQIKRNRQTEVQRARNKSTRSSLKTRIKSYLETAESGDAAASAEAYKDISRALDQAASKGVIHKNQAANKKSRLARKLPS